MAFKSFPENPVLKSEAEKTVYGLLYDQLPDDSEVYCNIEYFDGQVRRELDFLISIPELGLIALEVKGGAIQVDGQYWLQWDVAKREFVEMDLVFQLDEERRMVTRRLKGKLTKLPTIAWFAVFPDTVIQTDAPTPGLDRRQIISKSETEFLYRNALIELKRIVKPHGYPKLTQDIVRREFGVEFDYSEIVRSAKSRAALIDSLSAEQMFLLDLMQDNPRLLIKGGPGSGKTVLAIEHAARLADQKLRVGLVCYNRGLGKLLQNRISRLSEKKHPHFVGSLLDDLPIKWRIDVSKLDTSDLNKYFNQTLPTALLDRTKELQDHQKMDAWIVDEAQDLKPVHWDILRSSLRSPETGIIHSFGDNDQNLFRGADDLPWFYAIGRLNSNLRSTKQIASVLKNISESAGDPDGPINGSQPELIFIDDHDQAEQKADEYAQTLIDEFDWVPGDIVVVTTRQRHSKQEAQLDDIDGYWDEFFRGDSIFYTNVNSFKGLERPVVIVAVNGIPKDTDARQRFYVAMSRARDDLILVGTREDLNSITDVISRFNQV